MSRFVVIQNDLNLWKKSFDTIARENLSQEILDKYKPVGISRVYSVEFTVEEGEDCDCYDDSDMYELHRRNSEYFIQDPSLQTVEQYIEEHSPNEVIAEVNKSNIKVKLALVLEEKNA